MLKSGLKTVGHHAIFSVLEINRSIILQKLDRSDCFYLHCWFHFHGVSRAETDLHNKNMI